MASNKEEDASQQHQQYAAGTGGGAVSNTEDVPRTENDRGVHENPCIVRVGGIYSVLYEGNWFDARVTGMDTASVHVQYLDDDGTKERQIPKEDLNWRFHMRAQRSFGGRFANEEEAARAYDAAARERLGPNPEVNFPVPARAPDNRGPRKTRATARCRNCGKPRKGHSRSSCQPVARNAVGASRFVGVSARYGRWCTQISLDNVITPFGSFDTEEEAARCYDDAVRKHRGPGAPVNFPVPGSGERQAVKGQQINQYSFDTKGAPAVNQYSSRQRKPNPSSRHKGVHWNRQQRKWQVTISVDGKSRFGGRFRDEEEAARAYDAALRERRVPNPEVNFPVPGSGERRAVKGQSRPSYTTSRFMGVNKRGERGEAVIKHGGKRYYLGMFPSEEAAARAYDAEARKHRGPNPVVNFPVPGSGERQARLKNTLDAPTRTLAPSDSFAVFASSMSPSKTTITLCVNNPLAEEAHNAGAGAGGFLSNAVGARPSAPHKERDATTAVAKAAAAAAATGTKERRQTLNARARARAAAWACAACGYSNAFTPRACARCDAANPAVAAVATAAVGVERRAPAPAAAADVGEAEAAAARAAAAAAATDAAADAGERPMAILAAAIPVVAAGATVGVKRARSEEAAPDDDARKRRKASAAAPGSGGVAEAALVRRQARV